MSEPGDIPISIEGEVAAIDPYTLAPSGDILISLIFTRKQFNLAFEDGERPGSRAFDKNTGIRERDTIFMFKKVDP